MYVDSVFSPREFYTWIALKCSFTLCQIKYFGDCVYLRLNCLSETFALLLIGT